MVSVIITAYNYAKYVERAIRSCLDQSLSSDAYEIIVVNDASTDNTKEILANYKDEVRIIDLKKNIGLSAARNEGVRKAKGQYVVFVDADDYLQRDQLYVQQLFLEGNKNLDAVSVDYFTVDDKGNHIGHINAELKPIACGIMFRKDLLFEIGLYDQKFRAREEEDLRKRFLEKYSIYNIIVPLYRYRMHEKNLTKNKGEMDKYALLLKKKHKGK
jgi:glycosyltransferase involved in cell wall biosynthesis